MTAVLWNICILPFECRSKNSDAGVKLVGQIFVQFQLWLGSLSTVAATLADNQPSLGCFTGF